MNSFMKELSAVNLLCLRFIEKRTEENASIYVMKSNDVTKKKWGGFLFPTNDRTAFNLEATFGDLQKKKG